MAKRECGNCQECCYAIEVPPMNKGANEKCQHQGERGCAIYDTRPNACKVFECAWLKGLIPKSQKPSKIGVVVWGTSLASPSGVQLECLQANVRPGRKIPKTTWRALMVASGRLPVLVKLGTLRQIATKDGVEHRQAINCRLYQDGKKIGEWHDDDFVQMDTFQDPRTGFHKIEFKGVVPRAQVLASATAEREWAELEEAQQTVLENCFCGNEISQPGSRYCYQCQTMMKEMLNDEQTN